MAELAEHGRPINPAATNDVDTLLDPGRAAREEGWRQRSAPRVDHARCKRAGLDPAGLRVKVADSHRRRGCPLPGSTVHSVASTGPELTLGGLLKRYARQNGHADLLRESVDGQRGE